MCRLGATWLRGIQTGIHPAGAGYGTNLRLCDGQCSRNAAPIIQVRSQFEPGRLLRLAFAKARSVAMNRSIIGIVSLAGSDTD